MFGLSIPEILVVLVVTLIVFGPDKLPMMAQKIGRLMGEFRRHSDALRREFYSSVYTPVNTIEQKVQSELRGVRDEFNKPNAPANPQPTNTSETPPISNDSDESAKR